MSYNGIYKLKELIMKIPMRYIDDYLYLNPEKETNEKAPSYIPKNNLSKEIIKNLKDFNTLFKKCNGHDIISFS